MKRVFCAVLVSLTLAGSICAPSAAQQGNVPTGAQVRRTIQSYINAETTKAGFFRVNDPVIGRIRKVSLMALNKKVKKSGDRYYTTAIVRDLDNNEVLEVAYYVSDVEGKLSVTGERITNVAGAERKPPRKKGK